MNVVYQEWGVRRGDEGNKQMILIEITTIEGLGLCFLQYRSSGAWWDRKQPKRREDYESLHTSEGKRQRGVTI